MRENPWFRPVALLVLVVFATSCVTTRLPPISSAADQFEPLRDERRLWERSRDEEAKLEENVALYSDPLLVDYLEEVAARLNTPGMAANPDIGYRVRVIEDPTLNAFAYPHGSLYVHTGLLARMENEHQLATVLAHEMTHVENRHMLRYQRSVRNKQIGLSIAAIAAAVVIAHEQGEEISEGHYGKAARIGVLSDLLVGLGLQLALIAAVNGYGRDLEYEADQGAFEKLDAAGYDVTHAPRVYELLLAEHGESGKAEAFFFGSHPQLTSRIGNAREWIEVHPDAAAPRTGAPIDHDRFLRRIRPVIRDDARLNIEAGRYELADHELQRVLDMMPGDPETWLLIGQLRLKQAEQSKDPELQQELRFEAQDAFREAVRLDPERPQPHLELALLAYGVDDFVTACVQFSHYVELAPDAEDAPRVRDYLLELVEDGHCR